MRMFVGVCPEKLEGYIWHHVPVTRGGQGFGFGEGGSPEAQRF